MESFAKNSPIAGVTQSNVAAAMGKWTFTGLPALGALGLATSAPGHQPRGARGWWPGKQAFSSLAASCASRQNVEYSLAKSGLFTFKAVTVAHIGRGN